MKRELNLRDLGSVGGGIVPKGLFLRSGKLDVSKYGVKDDLLFCEWLAEHVGVGAVPGSCFFKEDVNHLIRLHFAKRDETLCAALDRLSELDAKAKYFNTK